MKTMKTGARRLFQALAFPGSSRYWGRTYAAGGTSGEGSYGDLAVFKAEIMNEFVAASNISSVIELGCGDGNQLALMKSPRYAGFDVSYQAVSLCQKRFATDPSKSFALLSDYRGEKADLGLSLDVIFHPVEDAVFEEYMRRLFSASLRHVILYSSNCQSCEGTAPHVRHRIFTDWVTAHEPGFALAKIVPNRYPSGHRPQRPTIIQANSQRSSRAGTRADCGPVRLRSPTSSFSSPNMSRARPRLAARKCRLTCSKPHRRPMGPQPLRAPACVLTALKPAPWA